jgi:hypothetical protein
MPYTILTDKTIQRRRHWIDELAQISGRFGEDIARVERELIAEIQQEGNTALLDLSTCVGQSLKSMGMIQAKKSSIRSTQMPCYRRPFAKLD